MAAPTLVRRPIVDFDRSAADPRSHVDWVLFAATLALAAFGLLAVYTATYQDRSTSGLDTLFFVKRQGLAIALGLVAMLAVLLVDYRKLRELALVFYVGTCGLLLALPVLGKAHNGAQAWFELGPFQLQPSEFAKVTLILVLAGFLGADRTTTLPFPRFLTALLITAIPTGLVLLQPDLGTASVLVVITMGVLLVANANPRHIAVVTGLALVSAIGLVGTHQLDQYQGARLASFLNPARVAADPQLAQVAYQVDNAKAAIAGGGMTGQGYLEGPYTNGGRVPENHTDFVFTAVAEQFGMVGAGLLLALYGLLALRIWRVARLARDMLGTLIAAGALTMLTWHVFQNVGMTTGIMPVTGIPLPLVSYGGSASIAFLVLIGLVQNVHMRRFV
jgi:rod shape determining protein RodA